MKLNPVFSAAEEEAVPPGEYELEQNYPNPFNPRTVIGYRIPTRSHVTLKVYDAAGREVAMLVDEEKAPGRYTVSWDASEMPSGVYFGRLMSAGFAETKKMLLVR